MPPDAFEPAAAEALRGPILSVLIPCWNAAATIERALGSVLDERTIMLECVVIDDGSTDDTVQVVEAIARRDPRVVLLRVATNGGVSNARNVGLAAARGTWLAFLDADDRLLPGGVAALMAPTADPSIRVVVAQRVWTDGERTWLSPVYDIPDIREPGRKSVASHPGLMSYASATGKVIHRSLIDGLAFEGRVLGDQPWTIRAMLRAGGDIEVVRDTVYAWIRPAPGAGVETITSATRASAVRATEMADVARDAFAAVSEEIDRQVADPARRPVVKRAYFDRLVHSDLASRVIDAMDRDDPGTADLFMAIGRFLESVPAPILTNSQYLARRLLLQPVARWTGLSPAVRAAYWQMLRPALRADPRSVVRVGGPLLAPAFGLVRWADCGVGRALASAWLIGAARGLQVGRWIARRRPNRRP